VIAGPFFAWKVRIQGVKVALRTMPDAQSHIINTNVYLPEQALRCHVCVTKHFHYRDCPPNNNKDD